MWAFGVSLCAFVAPWLRGMYWPIYQLFRGETGVSLLRLWFEVRLSMRLGINKSRSRLLRGAYCGTPWRVPCCVSRSLGVQNFRSDLVSHVALGKNRNLLLPTLVAYGVAGIDRDWTACGSRPLMPAYAGATEGVLGKRIDEVFRTRMA